MQHVVDKLKEVERQYDIIAIKVCMHPLGKPDYQLIFFVTYRDSYSFNLFLSYPNDETLQHYILMDEFVEEHKITDEDVIVVTEQHGAVPLNNVYKKVLEESHE